LRAIWAVSVLASILILGLGLSTQSYAATIDDNVIVGAGETLVLNGDTVNGNVEVNGGSIDFSDVTVNGNVIAENCVGENTIEGSTINGDIILQACNNIIVTSNTVTGSIKAEGATDCNVFDNDTDGNLEAGDCSTEAPGTSGSDFTVDSFFDVFYKIPFNPNGCAPGFLPKVTDDLSETVCVLESDFQIDSFFDVFYDIEVRSNENAGDIDTIETEILSMQLRGGSPLTVSNIGSSGLDGVQVPLKKGSLQSQGRQIFLEDHVKQDLMLQSQFL